MTIFVTWQSRVTMDSIRNSCDVLLQNGFPYQSKMLWGRPWKFGHFQGQFLIWCNGATTFCNISPTDGYNERESDSGKKFWTSTYINIFRCKPSKLIVDEVGVSDTQIDSIQCLNFTQKLIQFKRLFNLKYFFGFNSIDYSTQKKSLWFKSIYY